MGSVNECHTQRTQPTLRPTRARHASTSCPAGIRSLVRAEPAPSLPRRNPGTSRGPAGAGPCGSAPESAALSPRNRRRCVPCAPFLDWQCICYALEQKRAAGGGIAPVPRPGNSARRPRCGALTACFARNCREESPPHVRRSPPSSGAAGPGGRANMFVRGTNFTRGAGWGGRGGAAGRRPRPARCGGPARPRWGGRRQPRAAWLRRGVGVDWFLVRPGKPAIHEGSTGGQHDPTRT